MFKKAKYIYAFILFLIVTALFLFSSNLYADWIFDTTPPVMTTTLDCGGAIINSGDQCAENNVDVTLNCDDSGIGQSGCKTINYGYDNLGACEETETAENPNLFPDPNFETSFSIPNDGETYTICIESIDRAGNIAIGGTAGGANPIIVFVGSWFKLKDASFNSGIGRSINLPLTPEAYDVDDTTDKNLIIGSGGVVLSRSTYTITDWQYSASNWNNDEYIYKNTFSPENYKDYVLSNREYNEITDLANIEKDQINYYVGDADSSNIGVGNHPFILLVDGDITFDTNFNDDPENQSVALIATGNINIKEDITSIGAIIAADNIKISHPGDSNIPLKITGNIISTNEVDTSARERIDDRTKPSFFVVFSAKMYIDLIDYLSRATYDWKQLQ